MESKRRTRHWLALSTAAALATCALVTSCAHWFGNPLTSTSTEGVRLTVRDYDCMQVPETNDPQKGADLVVDLEISNRSSAPVTVQTGAMQVVDAEGGLMTRRGWSQKGPVQVAAGRNQKLTMHFLGSPKHCCSSRLSLNPSGVTVGDRTLAVRGIDFVPECLF